MSCATPVFCIYHLYRDKNNVKKCHPERKSIHMSDIGVVLDAAF